MLGVVSQVAADSVEDHIGEPEALRLWPPWGISGDGVAVFGGVAGRYW